MVTVRTVKLRNSWCYKKSSNSLPIGTYSKELLIQQILNGTIRNGCEYDTWIFLTKICRCTTKTLAAFKSPLFSCCAIVLSYLIYRWSTRSRNLLLSTNQLGTLWGTDHQNIEKLYTWKNSWLLFNLIKLTCNSCKK